jgi:sortase A
LLFRYTVAARCVTQSAPTVKTMKKVINSVLSVTVAVSLLGAGFVALSTFGTDVSEASAQEVLFEELAANNTFEPVHVNIAEHVVWYSPDSALQTYEVTGAGDAQGENGEDESSPDADPAPAVTPAQQKNANGKKNKNAASVPPADVESSVSLPKAEGAAFARIRIPAINVDHVVVSGTSLEALDKGPGVWRWGALPGELGNATISGHRTSHGGPFRHIDDLVFGDKIFIDIPGQPQTVYEVRGRAVTSPDDVNVTRDVGGARLTLTTCHPEHSTKYRLIVQAEMVEGAWVDQAVPADEWVLLGD